MEVKKFHTGTSTLSIFQSDDIKIFKLKNFFFYIATIETEEQGRVCTHFVSGSLYAALGTTVAPRNNYRCTAWLALTLKGLILLICMQVQCLQGGSGPRP